MRSFESGHLSLQKSALGFGTGCTVWTGHVYCVACPHGTWSEMAKMLHGSCRPRCAVNHSNQWLLISRDAGAVSQRPQMTAMQIRSYWCAILAPNSCLWLLSACLWMSQLNSFSCSLMWSSMSTLKDNLYQWQMI